MIATEINVAEVGNGTLAGVLFGLAIPALVALVKWWMHGIERRGELTATTVAAHSTRLAVLESQNAAQEIEIAELRRVKHASASISDVQAQEARCIRRHKGHDE